MPKQFRNRPDRDAFEDVQRPEGFTYQKITWTAKDDDAAPDRDTSTQLQEPVGPDAMHDVIVSSVTDDDPVEPTTEAAVDIFLHLANDVQDANEPDGMIWGHDQPHEIIEDDTGGEIFADGFETGM